MTRCWLDLISAFYLMQMQEGSQKTLYNMIDVLKAGAMR